MVLPEQLVREPRLELTLSETLEREEELRQRPVKLEVTLKTEEVEEVLHRR